MVTYIGQCKRKVAPLQSLAWRAISRAANRISVATNRNQIASNRIWVGGGGGGDHLKGGQVITHSHGSNLEKGSVTGG